MHSTLRWTKCSVRLSRSSNIVESVKMLKACCIKFKSVIGLNFHSTSIQFFLSSRKCWMVLRPFAHSVQQLSNTRMLTSGRESQYGVVYLDERVWFLVLSSSKTNFAEVLVLLLAQYWKRLNGLHTTLFLRPTSVQLLLNACWSTAETV